MNVYIHKQDKARNAFSVKYRVAWTRGTSLGAVC